MSDDLKKTSHSAEEKAPSKKSGDEEDPKQHGAGAIGGTEGSEAGGEPGEGRTGTGLGSTDS